MKFVPTAKKITAAARRLLDQQGIAGVTMRHVAVAVGITAMAIYRHFPDREALLNAVADEGFSTLAASIKKRRFRGTPAVRLAKMIEIYLDHALLHPRQFELMFLTKRKGARRFPGDFKAGRSPTANLIAGEIQQGMQCGVFRADDAWEVTFEMGALSHGLILLYLGGRIDASPVGFRALYRRTFHRYIHGILG
jgi:AcrR family transcriptional regulator